MHGSASGTRVWRCAAYVQPRSWRDGGVAGIDGMRQGIAQYLRQKPDVVVTHNVVSHGGNAPFDRGFDQLCGLLCSCTVDCVAVHDFGRFAPSGTLARYWLGKVLQPAGVRFLDATAAFDSLQASAQEYLQWTAR